jgi:hypothetical protein
MTMSTYGTKDDGTKEYDKMFWSNEPQWYEIDEGEQNEKAISIEE